MRETQLYAFHVVERTWEAGLYMYIYIYIYVLYDRDRCIYIQGKAHLYVFYVSGRLWETHVHVLCMFGALWRGYAREDYF